MDYFYYITIEEKIQEAGIYNKMKNMNKMIQRKRVEKGKYHKNKA